MGRCEQSRIPSLEFPVTRRSDATFTFLIEGEMKGEQKKIPESQSLHLISRGTRHVKRLSYYLSTEYS